jgi:bifunctional protein TilS/HprT
MARRSSTGRSATAAKPVPPAASVRPARVQFAHESEAEFARILDFYGISWLYEPRSFPLRWKGERVLEAFTPDFFLPDLNLYVELTTLRQKLATEKNRKVRLLRQLHPEINVKLLNKKDYLRLLTKYGYGPPEAKKLPDIDRVLISASQLQRRVGELGAQISRDYSGQAPMAVGVLKGVFFFMADLLRHISLPVSVDFMAISSYEEDSGGAVKILKDLDLSIAEQHVLLVEDIVDTGMTLNRILERLWSHRPASLKVCALLDKRARRLVDVPLDYIGFEIPDEFVVGYGLDYRQRYRNLPFIGVLKHELLP